MVVAVTLDALSIHKELRVRAVVLTRHCCNVGDVGHRVVHCVVISVMAVNRRNHVLRNTVREGSGEPCDLQPFIVQQMESSHGSWTP